MRVFSAIFILSFISLTGISQEIPEIETDRPDQTECSSVIPFKTIQVETGIVREIDRGSANTKNLYFPTTLIRIGTFHRAELRIVAGEYFISRVESDSMRIRTEGFSPLA